MWSMNLCTNLNKNAKKGQVFVLFVPLLQLFVLGTQLFVFCLQFFVFCQ